MIRLYHRFHHVKIYTLVIFTQLGLDKESLNVV
jgi:hypothetical protein